MFVGLACTMIISTTISAIERDAAARGERPSQESLDKVLAMVATAREAMQAEREVYEDAGLLPVYPRPEPPKALDPRKWTDE